jgi:hydroxypyruvate reductase
MALDAAASVAHRFGLAPVILGDAIEGEASEVGAAMAVTALSARQRGEPAAAPCVLISGGETTVTLRGDAGPHGRGGRNAEFLLAFALALNGAPRIAAIACDTDGIDGSEDNAGAWCDSDLLAAADKIGLDLTAHLAGHDAYTAFAALDRLVMTGPTLTNVNDFRAILIR